MMACPEATAGTALWEVCSERLHLAGASQLELPVDLASASSRDGRFGVQAAAFRINLESGTTEARLALVHGQSVNIFAMIALPIESMAVQWSPLLAIETMVIGHRVRLVFADLQDVGLSPIRREMVRQRAMPLAARPGLSSQTSPPVWATTYSLGGYFFTEKPPDDQANDALAVPVFYLNAWCDLAEERSELPGESFSAEDQLRQFKETHAAAWPGRAYLERLFGPAWTYRFIYEFFYR